MKGLNLSKFKKVSDSDSHAIFRHENGSELKIAKAGLSPKMRQGLAELPVHRADGDPDGTPSSLKAPAEDNGTPQSLQQPSAQPSPQSPVNININSGPTPQQGPQQPQMRDADGGIQTPEGKPGVMDRMKQWYADNEDQIKGYFDPNNAAKPDQFGNAANSAPPVPATPGGQVAANGPGLQGAAPPPGAQDPNAASQGQPPMVQAAPAPMPQPSSGMPQNPQQQKYQDTMNKLMDESNAVMADYKNGHITPETYHDLFAKKDTLGKIGTVFGLMLSGMGSGLTGQPNAVMGMMDRQIQNDLEAQKNTKEGQRNFLNLSHQMLAAQSQSKHLDMETAIQARTLANMNANQAALHHLVELSKQYPVGSPQWHQAQQTLTMLSQGVQSENYRLADRAAAASAYYSTIFGGQGQGGGADDQTGQRLQAMRMFAPEKAKELEERYVPGIGVSSVKVPDNVRQEMASKQNLIKTATDLMDYSKTHSNIIPGTPEYRYGVAKSMAVQQQVREGMLGTVFRESEKPLLEKFVNENPAGAFKAFNTQPKLRAILDNAQMSLNTTKKMYGFPESSGQQQPPTKQAGNAEEIRYDAQGNAYKRGADGRPVKINQTAGR